MIERIILDLKNNRKTELDNAQKYLNEKDMDKYNEAMKEVDRFNAEIEANEKLFNEQKRNPEPPKIDIPFNNNNNGADDDITLSKVDKARSGKEYLNAFINALRYSEDVRRDAKNQDYAPLYNALVAGGAGEDGGYLVPIDIENTINQQKRQLLDLSEHFNRETVTTLTGWRVVDIAPTVGLSPVDEMANIPKGKQPKFAKIEYKVRKYGDILPISNELLADNAANLMNYIANWFVKLETITKNNIILGLLRLLTPTVATAGNEVAAIKTALNKTLDPEISLNSKVITNQSGLNTLDLLVETTGKPLMQPDITQPTRYALKGRPIIVVSDANLPNVSGRAPCFIGDFMQYATVFTRKPFEMASTNIGGDAFATDSTQVRGITRLDAQVFDKDAAAYLQFPIPT